VLLSEVLDSIMRREGGCTVSVPDDWMQGRSVFGGLQVALGLRALRDAVPADLPLRVLQTTFVAPVTGSVEIDARVLRAGKGTTHAEARLVDRGETTTIVVGVFGRGRPSKAELVPQLPRLASDHEAIEFPFVRGISVAFAQHYKMRLLSGPVPFSGTTQPPEWVVEVSSDDRGPTSECQVVGIADAIPPLAFAMLTQPAPGSSVTWTLEMLVDRFDVLPLAGWKVVAAVRAGHNGYTSQAVTIFGPDGAAVALSHQSMVVFG
jgi:acyl-CoA thioesterase